MKLTDKVKSLKSERYFCDTAYRGSIGIYQGMALNFAYAAFRAFMGIRYLSYWFISSAVYYFVMGIIRAMLAHSYRRKDAAGGFAYEKRCYRRTAWLLFILNIPIGGMIIMMTHVNPSGSYPMYTIYASAAYTFYAVTVSAMNIAKFRKIGSPILSASKAVNFAAALMSLLGLQNALISSFSGGDDDFRILMNRLTGTGVYIAVMAMAIYMIAVSANKRKGGNTGE